jgi:apolipoprotein N-acyltransferase
MTETPNDPLSLPLRGRIGLALIAGLLLTAGYALHPFWWAPWLAPVPLIVAVTSGAKHTWLMGAIAGIVATLSVLGYYVGQSGALVGTLIIVVLRIMSWGGAARFVMAANRRLPATLVVLALPIFVAAIEAATLTVSIHGAAGSLAYSQMDLPVITQLASLGGVPLIDFVILLPGSLVGVWLSRRARARDMAVATGIVCALAVATGLYADIRLSAPPGAGRLHATLIATDRFDYIPRDWTKVWAVYAPQVARSARAGGVVVLPEKIALLDPAQTPAAVNDVRTLARQTQATIMVGVETHDRIYRNQALLVTPTGDVAWYTKQRLVPGFEARDVPGKMPLMIKVAGTPLGVAICKDMHVPSIGREYAGATGIMAVSAWDFGQDGWMGARMTQMRGIESGYAVARSARNGLVGAYDNTGRVIAEAVSSPGMTVVEADVPVAATPTLYARFGDIFGLGCGIALLAVLAGFFRKPNGGFLRYTASKT